MLEQSRARVTCQGVQRAPTRQYTASDNDDLTDSLQTGNTARLTHVTSYRLHVIVYSYVVVMRTTRGSCSLVLEAARLSRVVGL